MPWNVISRNRSLLLQDSGTFAEIIPNICDLNNHIVKCKFLHSLHPINAMNIISNNNKRVIFEFCDIKNKLKRMLYINEVYFKRSFSCNQNLVCAVLAFSNYQYFELVKNLNFPNLIKSFNVENGNSSVNFEQKQS